MTAHETAIDLESTTALFSDVVEIGNSPPEEVTSSDTTLLGFELQDHFAFALANSHTDIRATY